MDTEMKFFHQTPIQIRFNDLDILGHVNNTSVQEYFDLGRMNYFRRALKDIDWKELAVIIASIKTDFQSQIFIDDSVAVQTKVVHIGNKSFKMVQHIICNESDVVRATCESVMVGIDPKTKTSCVISDEWRDYFQTIEQDMEFVNL